MNNKKKINRNKILIQIFFIVFVFAGSVFTILDYFVSRETNHIFNTLSINGKIFKVEIAETVKDRQNGLMFREELCDNCGMLFVFPEEDYHGFWMKNTLIPLDMVFIDEKWVVVDILHAEPCKQENCKSYVPKIKSKYVLEVNANQFSEAIIGNKISK